MVPWHLQPKYSNQPISAPKSRRTDSAKAATKRAKKAEKQQRKALKKHGKNDRDSSGTCSVAEVMKAVGEEEEVSGCCLLGELGELCVEEMRGETGREREPEQLSRGHHHTPPTTLTGEGDDQDTEPHLQDWGAAGCRTLCSSGDSKSTTASNTGNLTALGYKTFQRYYHVFRHNELTELFLQVEGVRVLEEFYDHENWCVVVEKQAFVQNK